MAGAGEAFGAAGPSPSGSGASSLRRTTEKVEHQTRRHQTRRGRERGQGGELCLLAQALTGTRVAIELRDDTMLKGTILSATEAMDIMLQDVLVETVDGSTASRRDKMYIKSRSIRFMMLPENIDPLKTMKEHKRKEALNSSSHLLGQKNEAPRRSAPTAGEG